MGTLTGANWSKISWYLGLGSLLSVTGIIAEKNPILAQLIPDRTLGSETSVVTKVNEMSDRLDGGAIRGANLFHSFLEFNVGEARSVYFTNPDSINNILSRVTGNNPSHIFGKLGVLGNANLFLLNPNGIVFGENASLDIEGSFVATTASGIKLGEEGFFSAIEPQNSSLLSINPGVLFFNQVTNTPGNIINQGNLAVGKDLTLSGNNLALQGQLFTKGNLTLQALDTLQIEDNITNPFIAATTGNLLIQGNESVNIFALNHPQSGLFSGKNLILRSPNTVGGDAHFWSGGNFRIEKLDGSLTGLLSTEDPVIRSLGDVQFGSYLGTSLHILAAGKVEIPNGVQITGADPVNGLVETVTLSDGTEIAINGQLEPTLDIRAGVNPSVVGSNFLNPLDFFPFNSNSSNAIFNPNLGDFPSFSATPTSADINIGRIFFTDFLNNRIAGKVILTNQYQTNPTLDGDIQVFLIRSGDFSTSGGEISIDSKGDIFINGNFSSSAIPTINFPSSGNGGDVTLLAQNNINFAPNSVISSLGLLGGNITLKSQEAISLDGVIIQNENHSPLPDLKGGDINITARNLSLTNGAATSTRTWGDANSGDININVLDGVIMDGTIPLTIITSNVGSGANANAGNINIKAGSFYLTNGAQIQSGVESAHEFISPISGELVQLAAGQGNAGKITIDVRDAVILDGESNGLISGIGSFLDRGTTGLGGNIEIKGRSLSLTNGGLLSTSTAGQGNAGNVIINVDGAVNVDGVSNDGFTSGIHSEVELGGIGKGGDINITAKSFSLSNGAQIATSIGKALGDFPASQGEAGNININVLDAVTIDGVANTLDFFGEPTILSSGITSSLDLGTTGGAGTISITAGSLSLSNGGQLLTKSFGEGNAGKIDIDVLGEVTLAGVDDSGTFNSGLFSTLGLEGVGIGGDIDVKGQSLSITDGATLNASTAGFGDAGNVNIDVTKAITLDDAFSGIFTRVDVGAIGDGGDITINSGSLSLSNGAQLATDTFGIGNAGSILVKDADYISVSGGSKIKTDTSGMGNAGNVIIDAPSANISFDGVGVINNEITRSGIITLVQPVISEVIGDRTGGDIHIIAKSLSISNGAELNARTEGIGNAGNVNIDVTEAIALDGAFGGIFTRVESGAIGDGGDITINSGSLSLSNGAQLATDTFGIGNAGDINLDISGKIELKDFAIVPFGTLNLSLPTSIATGVAPGAVGNGGEINLQAESLILDNYSLITTATSGEGNAGDISLEIDDFINLSRLGLIESVVDFGAVGEGGDIKIKGRSLTLTDGSQIQTQLVRENSGFPGGEGKAGNIEIDASDFVHISGVSTVQLPVDDPFNSGQLFPTKGFSSGLFASTEKGANGNAGSITVTTNDFRIANGAVVNSLTANAGEGGDILIKANTFAATDGGQVLTTARNSGKAGNIALDISDRLTISGKDANFDQRLGEFGEDIVNNQGAESGLFANTTANFTGQGGGIEIKTNSMMLDNEGAISANSQGEGIAGNLTINATKDVNVTDSNITTSAEQTAGGAIKINAQNIRLEGDSDIRTNVASGTGGGGDITITADSILAFDDSDILAFARDGKGGNITLNTPVFFGASFQPAPEDTDPNTLDNNDVVDINASGAVAGAITIPDVSFIQNSLVELPDNLVDTDTLIANSCVIPNRKQAGTFIITGSGGLPFRPGDISVSTYALGNVRNVPTDDNWKMGDRIVEPQKAYRLPNGDWVLSRECSN